MSGPRSGPHRAFWRRVPLRAGLPLVTAALVGTAVLVSVRHESLSRSTPGPALAGTAAAAGPSGPVPQLPEEPPLTDVTTGPSASAGDPDGVGLAPPTSRSQPPTPAPPAPPARFTAVAGESCPRTATSGYFNSGWSNDWYARWHGGWRGDGCRGRMIAVPMSGDRYRDDPDNVVVWWFRPPASGTCDVSVHVPDTGQVRDAAGAPATYVVYASLDASGDAIGRFTVDQVHNQGRWMPAGSFSARTGRLSVRLVTRGVDWGGRDGAHLGASAVRVTC